MGPLPVRGMICPRVGPLGPLEVKDNGKGYLVEQCIRMEEPTTIYSAQKGTSFLDFLIHNLS